MKPVKPQTPTRDTRYPGKGYRVSRVQVRVGLAYPRVTRATPYVRAITMTGIAVCYGGGGDGGGGDGGTCSQSCKQMLVELEKNKIETTYLGL